MPEFSDPILHACEVVYEVFPDAFSRLRSYGIVEILDEDANIIAAGIDYHDAWANAATVARRELDRREQESDHGNGAGAILCASIAVAAVLLLCMAAFCAFHVSPWALILPGGTVTLAASAAAWEARHHPR